MTTRTRECFCLYKVGCKGPDTFSPCPSSNGMAASASHPVRPPCIGCTELYFFDRMTPFYKTLPNVNGFGVEASANIIGAVGVAGAGAAIAHAVGSAIHYKKQHMRRKQTSLPAFGDAPGSPDKEVKNSQKPSPPDYHEQLHISGRSGIQPGGH
ncbi:MAG: hypothetical protein ACLT8C_08400 [Akkermansia muciniphila]